MKYLKEIIFGRKEYSYWQSRNNPKGNIFYCLYRSVIRLDKWMLKNNLQALLNNVFPFKIYIVKSGGNTFTSCDRLLKNFTPKVINEVCEYRNYCKKINKDA